jgi:hypothetical protein
MSRTYRLRNLPGITAKKYVDHNCARKFNKARDAHVDDLLKDFYPDAFDSRGRWRWIYYGIRHDIERRFDREYPVPVGNKSCHPWVRWTRITTAKAWYKKNGNRTVRHHNRQLLMANFHLGDEVDNRTPFYGRKDGWDVWSLF